MNMNFAEQIDLLHSLIYAVNIAFNNKDQTVGELLKEIKKEISEVFNGIGRLKVMKNGEVL